MGMYRSFFAWADSHSWAGMQKGPPSRLLPKLTRPITARLDTVPLSRCSSESTLAFPTPC